MTDESMIPEAPMTEKRKASIYDYFDTDSAKETKGIEVDYGESGIFTLARAGGSNKAFTKKVELLMRPYRRFMRGGDISKVPEGVLEEVMQKAFIEHILLGWEGVSNKEGNALEYSTTAAEKLFKDLPELLADLQTVASDHTAYLQAEIETDSKN